MPKYTDDIVAGYTLYYTNKCIVEAMHVHVGDKKLTEAHSAKFFFVYSNGDTKVVRSGSLNAYEVNKVRRYIKDNHEYLYTKWKERSKNGYYKG